MKQTGFFTRVIFTFATLLFVLAGSLLLVGCATSDSGDYRSSAPAQDGHPHLHH